MLVKIKLLAHWLLGLIGLIVFCAYTNRVAADTMCSHVEIVFEGKPEGTYLLQTKDVLNTLYANEFTLVGKRIQDIDFDLLEKSIENIAHVKNATVYSDFTGQIIINIVEPTPILRFLPSGNQSSFLVDSEGKVLPVSKNYSPQILVFTGEVSDFQKDRLDSMRRELLDSIYAFGQYVHDDPFWSALIQQANVNEKSDLQLVPRLGYHNIELGKIHHFKKKLKKLKIFYIEGLAYTGWHKYSTIDLRYEGQIVCTKK